LEIRPAWPPARSLCVSRDLFVCVPWLAESHAPGHGDPEDLAACTPGMKDAWREVGTRRERKGDLPGGKRRSESSGAVPSPEISHSAMRCPKTLSASRRGSAGFPPAPARWRMALPVATASERVKFPGQGSAVPPPGNSMRRHPPVGPQQLRGAKTLKAAGFSPCRSSVTGVTSQRQGGVQNANWHVFVDRSGGRQVGRRNGEVGGVAAWLPRKNSLMGRAAN
jgi:hypothetical protein